MTKLIAVGASAGGVQALQSLTRGLPADLAAAVLVVMHIGERMSQLPAVLAKASVLPVAHGVDGDPLLPGRIYVAPPDHHMLANGSELRLTRGPREHHTRPAIDPTFRSVALAAGPDAIGVILTGMLDDGTAGLQVIKRCAGMAVVQSPDDAVYPDMPSSALRHVEVDHCVPLAQMGALLARLASSESEAHVTTPLPPDIAREQSLFLGSGNPLDNLQAIARPSTFTCPDCHGALWEVTNSKPTRFICHTGHAYSIRTLHQATAESADEAIWNALRATQEAALLLRYRAERAAEESDVRNSARWREAADELQQSTALLRSIVEKEPTAEP